MKILARVNSETLIVEMSTRELGLTTGKWNGDQSNPGSVHDIEQRYQLYKTVQGLDDNLKALAKNAVDISELIVEQTKTARGFILANDSKEPEPRKR